jgi:putative chitinase
MMRLTPALLQATTGCTPELAQRYAYPLEVACQHYGITTPRRLAHFLAQIGHESGSLRHAREIWGPTPVQLRYEGRADLGNVQPGDGERYRGRGLIQTTGRSNYRRAAQRLRDRGAPDFETQPELLELPEWAAWSAADYWAMRSINAAADADDLLRVTRLVNGGLNGLQDRQRRLAQAKAVLLPAPGEPPAAAPSPPPLAAAAPAPAAAPPQETTMPLPAFVAAALPAIVQAVPKLGRLFGSGSDVAERNVRAAELAVQIVQQATGAPNAQAAAEAVAADPALAAEAARAIEQRWLELDEAGGGGIAGARAADAAARRSPDGLWRSPSFVVALGLLPMVYMVLVSILFGLGPDWPSDVRAAIATAVVSSVLGGLLGYYFGQTTSRNRTAAER